MKTIKLFTILFLVMGVGLTSCKKGEMGDPGPIGETGPAGPQGEQGVQGEEGNANVQTYTFDISTIATSNFTVLFSELTQDVLDNDVILTYIQRTSTSRYYQIPGISFSNDFEVELRSGELGIFNYSRTTGASQTLTAGDYNLIKAIIIESSNTSSGKSENKDVLSELKEAGVDTNDYYQVADYYGLDY
jgi:hypothetical protein